MSIDKTGTKSAPSAQQLGERWMETIKAEHESVRDGVDSFESGFVAYRDILATYEWRQDTHLKNELFKRMIDGEATTEEIASDYRTNVLDHGLDHIVPIGNSAYKVALPQGEIAVIPNSMRNDPAIASALFTFFCRGGSADESLPGMLIPMPHQLSEKSLQPMDIGAKMIVREIVLWEEGNILHVESADGEKLADFAFSYPFERKVRSIDDPSLFLRTWNRHLEELLHNLSVNLTRFENSIPSGTKLYDDISEEEEEITVEPLLEVMPNLKRTYQIAEIAGEAFARNHAVEGTWLYRFVRTQIAEINNNRTPLIAGMSFIEMEDLSLGTFRMIANAFGSFVDPVKHIDKSFVATGTGNVTPDDMRYWLDVNFEGGLIPKTFGDIVPSNGIALRMMLDEIVYQAGAARGDRAQEITFHFEGGHVVIKDKGLRGAFDYYFRNDEARARLEDAAAKLGESGKIAFHKGTLADGRESTTAIEIAFDLKGGARADGSGDGVRGSSTTSSAGASGFRGIARSETAPPETASGDTMEDETLPDGAISGLATSTDTVLKGAALGAVASSAMATI